MIQSAFHPQINVSEGNYVYLFVMVCVGGPQDHLRVW